MDDTGKLYLSPTVAPNPASLEISLHTQPQTVMEPDVESFKEDSSLCKASFWASQRLPAASGPGAPNTPK